MVDVAENQVCSLFSSLSKILLVRTLTAVARIFLFCYISVIFKWSEKVAIRILNWLLLWRNDEYFAMFAFTMIEKLHSFFRIVKCIHYSSLHFILGWSVSESTISCFFFQNCVVVIKTVCYFYKSECLLACCVGHRTFWFWLCVK